ncbi:MAG TPA: DUF4214 domain-containing protein [Telluria sp.]|nr:DUF4214 domain-containing protein [Telluria sp.]
MASTYHADIQALYVAYFNRPADYLGLDFWENAMEKAVAAAGSDPAKQAAAKASILGQISAGFAASDEYLDVYGDLPTEEVIGTVYQNLFGHAPDLAGLVFWVNAVRGGHMTIANAVTTIAAGAQGTDKETFENKVAASVAFTNEFDTGEEVLAYNGEEALTAAKAFVAGITDDASLAAAIAPAAIKAAVAVVVDAGTPEPEVITVDLTAGVDVQPGTAGNDVFNAIVSGVAGASTLTALDNITGGAGDNVLNIADVTGGLGIPAGVTITGIQTVNLSSAGAANIDTTTGFTGLTQLNVLQAVTADVTVGAGTAATVISAGAADVVADDSAVVVNAGGAVSVEGGSTQTVTAKGGVDLSGATGAIVVTDTAQGTANSTVTDGTSVTMSTKYTASAATSSKVSIGAASAEPTGAVSLTETVAGVQGTATVAGDIAIIGGKTVTVTSVATQAKATTAGGTGTLTQSAVSVTGTADTTSVTINQTNEVAAVTTVAAVTGKTETASIVFTALLAGESVTVDGLTFTAGAAGTTAAQTAAAFANISAEATHGSSTRGTYSGANNGNFTSGAVSGTGSTTVVYTSTAPNTAPADIVVTDTIAAVLDQTVTTTQGVLAVAAKGTGGIAAGAVTINDAEDTITTVSLNSFASASITSDALTNLTLANAANKAVTVTNTAATSLDLTLNKVTGTSTIGLGAKYATLNVHTTGAASNVDVTATGVTALAIDGSVAVDLAGSTFGAVKTVTVSGAAGATFGSVLNDSDVTSINASASTGNISATIAGATAAYTGSAGSDTVTVSGTSVAKAINLGAGDDSITLASGTTAIAGSINGGAGTDVLAMAAADAVAASANGLFASKVTGFEVLELGASTAAQTVNIDVLGPYNTVSTGGATTAALTLAGFTTGGTLELTASAAGGSYIVTGAGFAAGTADVFNIAVNGVDVAAGSVTANKVETINVASIDADGDGSAHSLTVVGDAVKTINVSGDSDMTLTSANATVTAINASAMTGGLTYTTLTASAQTVTGGAGNDVLTAGAGNIAHTLIGGAGSDVLTANAGMTMMTGGAGADMFVIETASTNVNTYATITDAAAGDMINLLATGVQSFSASKLTLGSTAVFQDYANAAVNGAVTGGIVWFQFGGDTYIVQDAGATDSTSFMNGTDIVVKLTGMVDLSTTTLNTTDGILLIGAPGA